MIDTHAVIQRLRAAGFPEGQAEALTAIWQEVAAAQIDQLATKADLEALGLRLEHRLQTTKSDLEARGQAFETKVEARFATIEADIRLLKWMLGVLLAGVASLVLKAFFT